MYHLVSEVWNHLPEPFIETQFPSLSPLFTHSSSLSSITTLIFFPSSSVQFQAKTLPVPHILPTIDFLPIHWTDITDLGHFPDYMLIGFYSHTYAVLLKAVRTPSGHRPDAARSRPDIVRRPMPPGAVQRPPHQTGKCPRIRLQLGR